MKPTRATESEQLRRGHQHDSFEIRHLKTIQHAKFAVLRSRSSFLTTRDQGKSFERIGQVRIPGTRVDEHMIVERGDGSVVIAVFGEEDVRAGKPVTDKVRLHLVVTQLQDTDDTSGARGK